MFEIHTGVPEMEAFWKKLESKVDSGRANKSEIQKFKCQEGEKTVNQKLQKTLEFQHFL